MILITLSKLLNSLLLSIAISKSFNIDAQIVGRVEAHDGKKLTINSPYGEFTY